VLDQSECAIRRFARRSRQRRNAEESVAVTLSGIQKWLLHRGILSFDDETDSRFTLASFGVPPY